MSRDTRRHRQPSGSEPLTARSPLLLRAVLSALALIGGTVLGVVFAVTGSGPVRWFMVAIGAGTVLVAGVDLWVIARRARQ